jgi:hypothetical protein
MTALTEPPYEFREGGRPQARPGAQGTGWGAHGYDPARPEMAAIFYALGRGVAPGTRIERLRAIDVAPTVARLLGIDPPLQSEGRALPALAVDTGK